MSLPQRIPLSIHCRNQHLPGPQLCKKRDTVHRSAGGVVGALLAAPLLTSFRPVRATLTSDSAPAGLTPRRRLYEVASAAPDVATEGDALAARP